MRLGGPAERILRWIGAAVVVMAVVAEVRAILILSGDKEWRVDEALALNSITFFLGAIAAFAVAQILRGPRQTKPPPGEGRDDSEEDPPPEKGEGS